MKHTNDYKKTEADTQILSAGYQWGEKRGRGSVRVGE